MSLDLDKAIATLKSCQIIAEEDVRALCNKAKEIGIDPDFSKFDSK